MLWPLTPPAHPTLLAPSSSFSSLASPHPSSITPSSLTLQILSLGPGCSPPSLPSTPTSPLTSHRHPSPPPPHPSSSTPHPPPLALHFSPLSPHPSPGPRRSSSRPCRPSRPPTRMPWPRSPSCASAEPNRPVPTSGHAVLGAESGAFVCLGGRGALRGYFSLDGVESRLPRRGLRDASYDIPYSL